MNLLRPRRNRFLRGLGLALLGAAIALLVGCGEQSPPVAKLSAADVKAKLAEPAPAQPEVLRELEAQAGEIVDPGPGNDAAKALDATVDSLDGIPVVVNLWADWCEPCKQEMPIFQRVALEHRGKIGFLGVAVNTPAAKAKAYLRDQIFVPYPSILDEDGKVNIGTGVDNLPKTFFYDRTGKRFIHIGPYESEAALLADIKRYAS